ncbi:MAG: toxin-antitoxin system YwqK family antitoxin, partial [Bacteroidetes bacterium]
MRFNKILITMVFLACVGCREADRFAFSVPSVFTGPQRVVRADSLVLNPNEGLVFYLDKPFTGTSVAYFPDGKKSASIDYVAGKKHGIYRKWFEDGTLSFESHYSNGKQHGETKSWWRNG